nr:MAG TPA: Putative head tail adaptor [Caudoviricetes sp.]
MNDGVFQNDAPYKTGHLNKRVTLLKLAEVEDEYGLTHQDMVDAVGHKVWAKIEPLRGAAYIEAHKEGVKDIIRITIRYRANVTNDMFVKYRDKLYTIDTIIDPAEAHAKLELMCNIREAGENLTEPAEQGELTAEEEPAGGTEL